MKSMTIEAAWTQQRQPIEAPKQHFDNQYNDYYEGTLRKNIQQVNYWQQPNSFFMYVEIIYSKEMKTLKSGHGTHN